MSLTQSELSLIKIQLEIEQEISNRYDEYMLSCSNAELKKTCQKLASRHKNHYKDLIKMLA